MIKKICILGIGNKLMMDDGIGAYIVEELKKHNMQENLNFVIGETDIDYCLDEIAKADYAAIIDAVKAGKNPGDITVLSLNDSVNKTNLGLSLHNLHFFHMIKYLNKNLKGIIIGIEPYEINYGFGLSSSLENMLPQILKKIDIVLKFFIL